VDDALDRLVRAALNSVPAIDPAVIDELRSTVREALERLREERDAAERAHDEEIEACANAEHRAEAAEAEVRQLRDRLGEEQR
jgi:glutamyl-tRNA reductase